LNPNDGAGFEGGPRPGSPCPDVNLATDEGGARLLSLSGEGFVGLSYGAKRIDASSLKALAEMSPPVRLLEVAAPGESAAVVDEAGELARQYAMRPGDFYLLRPDQHVAGRWRRFEQQDVARALHRACAQEN
jgi:3-(3-hydroxy-phenyl)propionate hydroxylase